MTSESRRYYYIDWLRVLAILVVFAFHNAKFFDSGDWHIKNTETSKGFTIFIVFTTQWIMPLFFVLSGMSAHYALRFQTLGRYVRSKVLRLAVPLIVGMFTHISLQVYLERLTHGNFTGSFFEFLPKYFDGWYALGGNFAWMGLHLWYLEMLFVYSLLTLPLFLWLRSERMGPIISRLAGSLAKPCAIFLLAAPVILMKLIGDTQNNIIGENHWGGWAMLPHLGFFGDRLLCRAGFAADNKYRQTQNCRIGVGFDCICDTVYVYSLAGWGAISGSAWRFSRPNNALMVLADRNNRFCAQVLDFDQ